MQTLGIKAQSLIARSLDSNNDLIADSKYSGMTPGHAVAPELFMIIWISFRCNLRL